VTQLNLAVIAGDGIGTEVVAEGLKVLEAVSASAGLTISTTDYDLGARRYNATGETLPASVLAELRGQDAILLGAIGDPSVPPGVLERGVLLPLRFELDHHVNLRPVKLFPGVSTPLAGKTPADIDMVVCREGTEGPYVGSGGTLRGGTAHEVATEESLNTRFGVERIVRDAFARAEGRRGKVTLVHKTNVLVHAGSLWQRTFTEVAAEHPAVSTDYCHVDAASMFFLTQPERFDVVVTDNLFGDMLSDVAAMLTGSLGMLPSASLDERGKGMYEPIHGSAPDIAGKGVANPLATILSVAMMLRYSLSEPAMADRIQDAVDKVLDRGLRTPDIMSEGMTEVNCEAMGDAVVAAL